MNFPQPDIPGQAQAQPYTGGQTGMPPSQNQMQQPTHQRREIPPVGQSPFGPQGGLPNQSGTGDMQNSNQPYGAGGQAGQYQGAPNTLGQDQPMLQGMPNQPTSLNQPMGQGQPGQSQGSAVGMPGPAQDGERGWKGAAAGGIGGGLGGNQLGDTGTTLISTLAGAVLGSNAEDKFFSGDKQGDDESKLHQLYDMAKNNGGDTSKVQDLYNMTQGGNQGQQQTPQYGQPQQPGQQQQEGKIQQIYDTIQGRGQPQQGNQAPLQQQGHPGQSGFSI